MKVGIVGYGNLGKSVEKLLIEGKRHKLVAIFSKRDNVISDFGSKIDLIKNIEKYIKKIDVMIICSGSYDEIEKIGPNVLKNFNTIDSFDTHKKIVNYKNKLNLIAKLNKKVAITACGWDPGLLSMIRIILDSVNGELGSSNSFWGEGVSQGHSNAIRKINGVTNAIQYTIPSENEINETRKNLNYSPEDSKKHKRVCYVSISSDNDKDRIENEIKNMKNYFFGYETEVYFVSEDEIIRRQKDMRHKGFVINNFALFENKNFTEFSLKLDSNPMFTANILINFLNVISELKDNKEYGAYTVYDFPLKYLFKNEKAYLEI